MTTAMMVAWEYRVWPVFAERAPQRQEAQKALNDYENSNGSRSPRSLLERSGLLTALVLVIVLGILGLVWAAHLHGRIHQLTTAQTGPESAPPPRPGGEDVIALNRMVHDSAAEPEFSSVRLLPGLGLEVLQLNLQLPGHPEIPLLLGSPDADLAKAPDKPVASPFQVTVQTQEGQHWSAPREILSGAAATQSDTEVLPDGYSASADFVDSVAGMPDVETKMAVMLSSRGVDLTISAKNVSTQPRGITVTWAPRFLAPSAGLRTLRLLPPETVDHGGNRDDTRAASASSSIPLGESNFNRTFSGLKYRYLSTGPEIDLRNLADGYTLRLTALTSSIRSMHAAAARDGNSVLLTFSTSTGEPDAAPTVLAPGQTLQWRVRLEATMDIPAPASAE